MKTWQIILFIGICSAATFATDDVFFDSLSNNVQNKLASVISNVGMDGAEAPFGEFVDDVEEMINKIKGQAFGGMDAPDADKVGKMFDTSIGVLEKSKRSGGGKNKRLMKEISEKAKEGISVLGTAMQTMITKLKPMREKATKMALGIQKSVDEAADKFVNAVVSAG